MSEPTTPETGLVEEARMRLADFVDEPPALEGEDDRLAFFYRADVRTVLSALTSKDEVMERLKHERDVAYEGQRRDARYRGEAEAQADAAEARILPLKEALEQALPTLVALADEAGMDWGAFVQEGGQPSEAMIAGWRETIKAANDAQAALASLPQQNQAPDELVEAVLGIVKPQGDQGASLVESAAVGSLPALPQTPLSDGENEVLRRGGYERSADIAQALMGPHEWGYRDPVEGGWMEDVAPFAAAELITYLRYRIEVLTSANRIWEVRNRMRLQAQDELAADLLSDGWRDDIDSAPIDVPLWGYRLDKGRSWPYGVRALVQRSLDEGQDGWFLWDDGDEIEPPVRWALATIPERPRMTKAPVDIEWLRERVEPARDIEPPTPPGARPEVRAFADLMEAKLKANDHKPGWKGDDPEDLLTRLGQEGEELYSAISRWRSLIAWGPQALHLDVQIERVGAEAADVANFAMMIADVCGALPQTPVPGDER